MNVHPMLDLFLAFMAIVGVMSIAVAINDFGGMFLDWIQGKRRE